MTITLNKNQVQHLRSLLQQKLRVNRKKLWSVHNDRRITRDLAEIEGKPELEDTFASQYRKLRSETRLLTRTLRALEGE